MRVQVVGMGFIIFLCFICVLRTINGIGSRKLKTYIEKRREQLKLFYDREDSVKLLNGLRVEWNEICGSMKKFERKYWRYIKRYHFKDYKKIQNELMEGMEKNNRVKRKLSKRKINAVDDYRIDEHPEDFFEYYKKIENTIKKLYFFAIGCFAFYLMVIAIITGISNSESIWNLFRPAVVILVIGFVGSFLLDKVKDAMGILFFGGIVISILMAILVTFFWIIIIFFHNLNYAWNIWQRSSIYCVCSILGVFIIIRLYYWIDSIINLKRDITLLRKAIDEKNNPQLEERNGSPELTNENLGKQIEELKGNLDNIKSKSESCLDNGEFIAETYWDYRFLKALMDVKITDEGRLISKRIENVLNKIASYNQKVEEMRKNK